MKEPRRDSLIEQEWHSLMLRIFLSLMAKAREGLSPRYCIVRNRAMVTANGHQYGFKFFLISQDR